MTGAEGCEGGGGGGGGEPCEPRTLAARKAYPASEDLELEETPAPAAAAPTDRKPEPGSPAPPALHDDAQPLDLSVRKVSVCDFARHPFTEAADFVRTQLILSQSQSYLATRDSGTESDDSAGRFSPGDELHPGKPYKKSLIKRYSKLLS